MREYAIGDKIREHPLLEAKAVRELARSLGNPQNTVYFRDKNGTLTHRRLTPIEIEQRAVDARRAELNQQFAEDREKFNQLRIRNSNAAFAARLDAHKRQPTAADLERNYQTKRHA